MLPGGGSFLALQQGRKNIWKALSRLHSLWFYICPAPEVSRSSRDLTREEGLRKHKRQELGRNWDTEVDLVISEFFSNLGDF